MNFLKAALAVIAGLILGVITVIAMLGMIAWEWVSRKLRGFREGLGL